MGKNDSDRYVESEIPNINGFILGDSGILYKEGTGDFLIDNIESVWEEFYQYLNNLISQNMDETEELQVIGGEMLKWVEKRDAFALSVVLKSHPHFIEKYILRTEENAEGISDNYLSDNAHMLLNALIKS